MQKKRLATTLFILFTAFIAKAQVEACNCEEVLNTDLKNKISTNDYKEIKSWFYDYLKSNAENRNEKKSNKKSSWGIAAVIDDLPLEAGQSSDGSSLTQKFSRIEREVKASGSFSDYQLNELISEQFSDNQLEAYSRCLDLCKNVLSAGGIKYVVEGDLNDVFSVRMFFSNPHGGAPITFEDDVIVSNASPIYPMAFSKNNTIKSGQSKVQFFKRLSPEKDVTIGFNFVEPIDAKQIVLKGMPKASSGVPIGSIVASILPYRSYLEANGFPETNDMQKAIWVPCDGRNIGGSIYGKYSGGIVPDLRGVFLRGINDFGVQFPSVGNVASTQKNPVDKKAGQFQDDAFQGHYHQFEGTVVIAENPCCESTYLVASKKGGQPVRDKSGNYSEYIRNAKSDGINGDPRVTSETRPKNITVYYYIKIN